MKKYSYKLAVLTLSLFTIGAVSASSFNDDLITCQKIKTDAVRLACYDQLAISLQDTPHQVANKDNVSMPSKVDMSKVDTSKVDTTGASQLAASTAELTTQEQAFGANHIKSKNKDQTQQDKVFEFEVAEIKKDPLGKLKFYFTNGQRWKQSDTSRLNVKKGDHVILKEGFLGAIYLKKMNSNKKIRVKRVK